MLNKEMSKTIGGEYLQIRRKGGYLCINKQKYKLTAFAPMERGNTFHSYNGFELVSADYPEVTLGGLYVRGKNEGRDSKSMSMSTCSVGWWNKLCVAVSEYNHKWKKQSDGTL